MFMILTHLPRHTAVMMMIGTLRIPTLMPSLGLFPSKQQPLLVSALCLATLHFLRLSGSPSHGITKLFGIRCQILGRRPSCLPTKTTQEMHSQSTNLQPPQQKVHITEAVVAPLNTRMTNTGMTHTWIQRVEPLEMRMSWVG